MKEEESEFTLAWQDERLRDREHWTGRRNGVFAEVHDQRGYWTWRVEGRVVVPACQPSLGDKDKVAIAEGQVVTREQAFTFANTVADLFLAQGLAKVMR